MISKQTIDQDILKIYIDKFLQNFTDVYLSQHLHTPYIHIFMNHLSDLISTYPNISSYNQQGLEKLNDITTKEYFMASNKKKFYKKTDKINEIGYIQQILFRRLRIDRYEYEN